MTPQSRWDDIAVKRRLQDTVREEALAYRALSATSDSSRVDFSRNSTTACSSVDARNSSSAVRCTCLRVWKNDIRPKWIAKTIRSRDEFPRCEDLLSSHEAYSVVVENGININY